MTTVATEMFPHARIRRARKAHICELCRVLPRRPDLRERYGFDVLNGGIIPAGKCYVDSGENDGVSGFRTAKYHQRCWDAEMGEAVVHDRCVLCGKEVTVETGKPMANAPMHATCANWDRED